MAKYEIFSQLEFKENEVINNLKELAASQFKNQEIIGSKEQYFYRNKMEFTFSNKRWLSQQEIQSEKEIKDRSALGFHAPGMFDKVIDINHCHLQKEPSNSIRLSVKQFADKNKPTTLILKIKMDYLEISLFEPLHK